MSIGMRAESVHNSTLELLVNDMNVVPIERLPTVVEHSTAAGPGAVVCSLADHHCFCFPSISYNSSSPLALSSPSHGPSSSFTIASIANLTSHGCQPNVAQKAVNDPARGSRPLTTLCIAHKSKSSVVDWPPDSVA